MCAGAEVSNENLLVTHFGIEKKEDISMMYYYEFFWYFNIGFDRYLKILVRLPDV